MTTLSPNELRDSLEVFDAGGGKRFSVATLKNLLPNIETALFFGKVYELDYTTLSKLLRVVFKTDLLDALMSGGHSTELQDYIVSTVPPHVWPETKPTFVDEPPKGELLPELWASLEIDIATSIKDVANKLVHTLHLLPSKEGKLLFSHMAVLNRQRPTVGDFRAGVHHERITNNLVILDVSGSMTEHTIRSIIDDVVALSWKANAHLAIVSNSTYHWEPGSYNVKDVLARAEFGGTHYETLAPLLNQDWGTVITIADYDSSSSAKEWIASNAKGRIAQVLDISLVNSPTYLAECMGQLADDVRPLLIGNSRYVLS